MPSICRINMVRQNWNSVCLTNNVLTVCCTVEELRLPNILSKISNWSPYIFILFLKVRFGYAKFILIPINQCLAETLHAVSFKNNWYIFYRRC